MRIVYTNLEENDAGVKRSVKQLRVEFNGTRPRPAPEALLPVPAAAAPDEGSEAERLQRAQTRETAHAPEAVLAALHRQRMTPPQVPSPVAGMGGFRSIFIKKFVDTQRAVLAGNKGKVSITI